MGLASSVVRWNVSACFPTGGEVLRAIPPVSAFVDLLQPERPIYFADQEGSTLWTASSDGTGQRLTRRAIRADNVTASAIWVDSALQLVYWTERRELDTRAANLGTLGQVTTVLLVPVADTKVLAIDDVRGWIYWSDVAMGRVMRARLLDGSGLERFWAGSDITSGAPLVIEPTSGDLIAISYSYNSRSASVLRRSLRTGTVSTLTVYLGSAIGLASVQLDPRHDSHGNCTRLWLGLSSGDGASSFVGTACAGDTQITPVAGLSASMAATPSLLLLMPYLGHCLPPTGLRTA
jgi:hypothetical protein